jgi:predicted DNA-binding transcriptional regulator AlpA
VTPPRPSQTPEPRSGDHTSNPVAPLVLTVEQVAELLQVSRWWVYDHGAELGRVKLGDGPRAPVRFLRERVADYLARRAEGAASVAEPARPTSVHRSQRATRKPARRVALLDPATRLRPGSDA